MILRELASSIWIVAMKRDETGHRRKSVMTTVKNVGVYEGCMIFTTERGVEGIFPVHAIEYCEAVDEVTYNEQNQPSGDTEAPGSHRDSATIE